MSVSEESVFAAALEKQNCQERAAFLDRACAGKPSLRQSVESLLSACASSGLTRGMRLRAARPTASWATRPARWSTCCCATP
jgi:hypothetical protein